MLKRKIKSENVKLNQTTILDKINGKFVPQITYGFYRFFAILSWYSQVRGSESLLFQLTVNRD